MSRKYLCGLIAAGDKDGLREALDNPAFAAFAHGTDTDGRSLLHDALAAGWEDVTARLIQSGAPVHTPDAHGQTPLHIAAVQGLTAAAEILIRAGATIDARAHDTPAGSPVAWQGDTPLHLAVQNGHAQTAAFLLAQGADPKLTSPATSGGMPRTDGMNVFHRAAAGDSIAVLDVLLAHADAGHINDFCDTGKTRADGFRLALQSGHVAVVQRLIDHGVDLNRRDSEGHRPLHWLLLHRRTRAEALPMIRLLLTKGADGDKATNLWGETPLMTAAKADFPEAIALLLDHGADAKRQSKFLETALHFAAKHYTIENITLLLDAGADIDAADRTGHTPLHIAAHHNRRDVVKTLIARGANALATDRRGRTPDQLCQAPIQENTRYLVLQAQKNAAHPAPKLENGRLRSRFTIKSRRQSPLARPIGKKPPSNGGGYRP